MPFTKGFRPWNRGLKGVLKPNATSFKPGNVPANKGTKGLMKPNAGSFGRGINAVGSKVKPPGSRRWCSKSKEVFVKMPGPGRYAGRYQNTATGKHGHWRPQRLVTWEAAFGNVPPGNQVRRLLPLCDCLSNLVLISNAVSVILNGGRWCNPPMPWHELPAERDVRLLAVHCAIAKDLAGARAGTHYRRYARKRDA